MAAVLCVAVYQGTRTACREYGSMTVIAVAPLCLAIDAG
jgi:hypothetical protein